MKKSKFKTVLMSAVAVATSLTFGVLAACNGDNVDDEDKNTTTKIDKQDIKNGNFEYYSDNEGKYFISSPDSWSGGTSGNSSTSMSGIINTRKDRWDYITDETLPETLDKNDKLESSDEDKVDYNGALADDLPYKNSHSAIEQTDPDDGEKAKAYIENPFTHEYSYDDDGVVKFVKDGVTYTTYTKDDDENKLYYKITEDGEEVEKEVETSVLMLHNYRRNYYTGTESYYNSSTSLTLEANTAAKISVWVKTAYLYFDGSTASRTPVNGDRGAYIKVATTVGGNNIDAFFIKNIDTEKLNPDGENNGWVEYNVFIEASSFADTTFTLSLGLGENDIYTCEGYAFFDDISYTKYINGNEMQEENAEAFTKIDADNTSLPISPDGKLSFRVDRETYQTDSDGDGNINQIVKDNNFEDRCFFIDFASSTEESALTFGSSTVRAGLTVEDTTTGKFVSARYDSGSNAYNQIGVGALDNGASTAFVPTKLGASGIKLTDDLIGTIKIANTSEWKNDLPAGYAYNELLSKTLEGALSLPGVGADGTSALVIMSSRGAAYQAEISDASFSLSDGENALISFWIKTSAMDGKTAATITAVDAKDDTNSSNFSVDSTSVGKVNIGDKKDVYDGWVKCFVRVSNTSGDKTADKEFKLKVNFGETVIKGTTQTSYKSGWLIIANASVMELDDDVFGYTSGAAHAATLSYTETKLTTSQNMDSEQGDKNVIKHDLATPSSYTGVNGGSINVLPSDHIATEYDKTNANPYAGLANKEYAEAEAGNYQNSLWWNAISAIHTNLGIDTDWSTITDSYCVQPLIIVNTVRTIAENSKMYNYGFIGTQKTVSADAYQAVSVRVKVSEGAIANVYLIEEGNSKNVMSYAVPAYNFWYDDEGNILKGEPKDGASIAEKRANIAYKLREDGLYESTVDGDNKLYANFYNLQKYYDIKFEHSLFYKEDGTAISFNDLVTGETYYGNNTKTVYAPHYLIAGGEGNNKVYLYKEGVDGQACYYYMENGKPNESKTVYGIDINPSTAIAEMRYDYASQEATPYQFTIDASTPEGKALYANKWVTVTFNIHAGSEAKNYKLELWSGHREEESSYDDGAADSYVIFDYSSVSLDQTSYETRLKYYTDEIIAEYRERVDYVADNDASIADLEKLADEKVDLFNYKATYYTYCLYDSADFIPFNGETTEGNQTGYSYSYSDYDESLAYLSVEDTTSGNLSMTAFIDYSVVDKDIDIIGAPTVGDGDDEEGSTTSAPDTNFWLLLASILLVVAIIIALVVLLVRDFMKKHPKKAKTSKNNYNFNKNKRYVKKYVKENGEAPETPVEVPEEEVDTSLLNGETEAPAEENADASDEQPAAPAEENAETPAEENTETPTESDENAAEQKADDGDKPDGE